jgi:alpha-mannosidase
LAIKLRRGIKLSKKTDIYILHSSHLDLYWIGAQEDCLEIGSKIIDNAIESALQDVKFHFFIESARFIEYYIDKFPGKLEVLKGLIKTSQIEIAASYTDRLENSVDGESLVRNILYGKKILKNVLDIDSNITCHPDLPGFAEQTPQIYKKSGIKYYMSARGLKKGARFLWEGLDGSKVVRFNFPGNYGYYSVEKDILPAIDEIKESLLSDFILLGCSAGDLGPCGTFALKEDGKFARVDLTEMLSRLNGKYENYDFKLSGAGAVLDKMDNSNLSVMKGESPSRWGQDGAAKNVKFYDLDKKVSAELLEAEKFSTVCSILGDEVELGERSNPLIHKRGNGGTRRYFELKQNPRSTKEWIEFAWRLQIITQDHNFGGVDGAQTSFDRIVYKEAALKIAREIKKLSYENIASRIAVQGNSLVVFNSLNWVRSGEVDFEMRELDENKRYAMYDNLNNEYLLFKKGNAYVFYACGVPSFGYKVFEIKECGVRPAVYVQLSETDGEINVENSFYKLSVDKNRGTIISLKDIETDVDWIKSNEFLSFKAYEDKSIGGSERIVDKLLLDSSTNNIRRVNVIENNAMWIKIEIVSDVCDTIVKTVLTLSNVKKELKINTRILWSGIPDIQLKLNVGFKIDTQNIMYGVPYGAQKYGNYMKNMDYSFNSEDEISFELFDRYREIEGWIAVDKDNAGLVLTSNHSAFDLEKDNFNVMLLRDVKNGADNDVKFSNDGELNYEFTISSYQGGWAENNAYKFAWERQFPLQANMKSPVADCADEKTLPQELSFIETKGNGILTVFKKSETDKNGYIARVFSCLPTKENFSIDTSLDLVSTELCNLDESKCSDNPDILGSYEIKTIKFQKN